MAKDPEALASGCLRPFEVPGASVVVGNLCVNARGGCCKRAVVPVCAWKAACCLSRWQWGKEAISGSQRALAPAVRGGREGEVALEHDRILLAQAH